MGLGGSGQETAILLCKPLVLFDICMYTLANKESQNNML